MHNSGEETKNGKGGSDKTTAHQMMEMKMRQSQDKKCIIRGKKKKGKGGSEKTAAH